MAFIDKTREGNFQQKKGVSIFSAVIEEGTDLGQVKAGSGNYLLALLPPDSVITGSFIHVITASDAATTNVATLGTVEGGSQIMSAGNLKATGKQGTAASQSLTGTGKPLYLGITTTGAATDVAKYLVVVEYIEYTKHTGEYTQISK